MKPFLISWRPGNRRKRIFALLVSDIASTHGGVIVNAIGIRKAAYDITTNDDKLVVVREGVFRLRIADRRAPHPENANWCESEFEAGGPTPTIFFGMEPEFEV